VKQTTKIILAAACIAVMFGLQACSRSQASSEATSANNSAPSVKRDDQALGCHPMNANGGPSSTETATTRLPVPTSGGLTSNDMVLIKGGAFLMGTTDGLPVEGPVHEVAVKSFHIDAHEVTVAQFAEFINATGYKTEAEQAGWSGVFDVQASAWEKVDGANWQHPEGPSSTASANEPVTQVSWNDATAYAKWAGKRLPTEAEFEDAERGGLVGKKYAWGDELTPDGKYRANWWQGVFPARNLGTDGFIGRAVVGSFPANGYGLYDITGNVWEWCADWYGEIYYRASPRNNPQGPTSGEDRVIRGGSWLCSDNYCTGYRVAARNHTAPDTGLNNLGFRCVRDE
jgi:sulfatase modifying factor 1